MGLSFLQQPWKAGKANLGIPMTEVSVFMQIIQGARFTHTPCHVIC